MNNKIDDTLFTLLKAKESIVNSEENKDVLDGLDNIITNYTINNKMSNKEILDCALSIYGKKYNNKFLEKLDNLRPSKIIKKIKNKIDEYHKKKELKEKYEKEIVKLVKDKLQAMINEDRKAGAEKVKTNNEKQDVIDKIPIYNMTTADKIVSNNLKAPNTFIVQKEDKFCTYRNKGNSLYKILEFNTLEKAIIGAKDKSLTKEDIINNFDEYKNKYGNLAGLVIDKRNINNNFKEKSKTLGGV